MGLACASGGGICTAHLNAARLSMSGSCSYEGCTVDETGTCALARDAAACSNRKETVSDDSPSEDTLDQSENYDVSELIGPKLGAPVLFQPSGNVSLPSSQALGLEEMNALMGSRYVNLTGILGDPESGKTACLASLYLLLSHKMLSGWTFADSKSLMAFEDISRGARDWNNGTVPDQMTVHTELADEHRPGFLHLRLVRTLDGRRVDLALPDVPGEWTQALVQTANSARLDFLKSAEVIWIVLDGRALSDIERRQGLIARVGQLVGRLKSMLSYSLPRLIAVITHCDHVDVSKDVESRIMAEFERRGAVAKIARVAPFSDDPDKVAPGYGIAELIDLTIGHSAEQPLFWNSVDPVEKSRAYLSYRRDQ